MKQDFIEFALSTGVLRFGQFTLKSGRSSPYFFNTGLFQTGAQLAQLGRFYAAAVAYYKIEADVLYGPAYKGIPLVTTTAIALSQIQGLDLGICFNRKEAKAHGEGGNVIGTHPHGRVLILDDVITAGTSVAESVSLIRSFGAEPCGVLIALDRLESGETGELATAEIRSRYDIPVHAIVTIDEIKDYLAKSGGYAKEIAELESHDRKLTQQS